MKTLTDYIQQPINESITGKIKRDMKINDLKDIDEMIDILKSPRDFAGGDVENLIKELESKK